MKIIKIKSCDMCPHNNIMKNKILELRGAYCEAEFGFSEISKYIKNKNIPKWCPLEDYEDK